jgi:hypothetical protein
MALGGWFNSGDKYLPWVVFKEDASTYADKSRLMNDGTTTGTYRYSVTQGAALGFYPDGLSGTSSGNPGMFLSSLGSSASLAASVELLNGRYMTQDSDVSMIELSNQFISFYSDTGKTVGVEFTPTKIASITNDGLIVGDIDNQGQPLQVYVNGSSQVRVTDSTTEDGGLFFTQEGSFASIGHDAERISGSWTARGTDSSQIILTGNNVRFYSDSGLTDDATFVPSEVARFSVQQLELNPSDPSTTNQTLRFTRDKALVTDDVYAEITGWGDSNGTLYMGSMIRFVAADDWEFNIVDQYASKIEFWNTQFAGAELMMELSELGHLAIGRDATTFTTFTGGIKINSEGAQYTILGASSVADNASREFNLASWRYDRDLSPWTFISAETASASRTLLIGDTGATQNRIEFYTAPGTTYVGTGRMWIDTDGLVTVGDEPDGISPLPTMSANTKLAVFESGDDAEMSIICGDATTDTSILNFGSTANRENFWYFEASGDGTSYSDDCRFDFYTPDGTLSTTPQHLLSITSLGSMWFGFGASTTPTNQFTFTEDGGGVTSLKLRQLSGGTAGYGSITLEPSSGASWAIGGQNVSAGYVQIGGATTTRIRQSSTTAAVPVLEINQADVSEEMIKFTCTIGTGNGIEAVGSKSLTVTHFIKVELTGGLTRYIEAGTIA